MILVWECSPQGPWGLLTGVPLRSRLLVPLTCDIIRQAALKEDLADAMATCEELDQTVTDLTNELHAKVTHSTYTARTYGRILEATSRTVGARVRACTGVATEVPLGGSRYLRLKLLSGNGTMGDGWNCPHLAQIIHRSYIPTIHDVDLYRQIYSKSLYDLAHVTG